MAVKFGTHVRPKENAQRSHSRGKKSTRRGERGEAEMMLFGVVVILCAIVSGTIILLNWIKDSKDAKIAQRIEKAMARGTPQPVPITKDPAEYFAHCQKSPAELLNNSVKCTVMDESYGELLLLPE